MQEEPPSIEASGSDSGNCSGLTLATTLRPRRRARQTSLNGRSDRRAACTFSGCKREIPSRSISSNFMGTPSTTMISAATLIAASQPSRSSEGSDSAIPICWAFRTASSRLSPASIPASTTLVVELRIPRKPSTRAAGRVSRKSEKMGTPSITADSKKNERFFCLARAHSSS